MTVRIERTFVFDAPAERVWRFIADPAARAEAISVVEEYEVGDDGSATWHVSLPVPGVSATVTVETEELVREPPDRVRFVGRSSVLRVTGEHEVRETAAGTELHNEFVVDGRLPGVERFFKRNLDAELDNLEAALRERLEAEA